MHKYFAKTQFLGKKAQYLTQCHSTNDEIGSLAEKGKIQHGHLIVAGHQTGGKGQRGKSWESEPDKNLLFSFWLQPAFLNPDKLYLFNVGISVALHKALLRFAPSYSLEIKWPNDIYLDKCKLLGVLVESSVLKRKVDSLIVGIGINVNQIEGLPEKSCSLASVTGVTFDLDEILEEILLQVEAIYIKLEAGETKNLLPYYHQHMFWRGEIHEFIDVEGRSFSGEIIGIDGKGSLMIKQDDKLLSYDLQQIVFVS